MNDTESRLRDYLDAKAATVPANEQGPGLFEDTHRRRPVWPILATAAAVAAVLALTVTTLTHLNADKADPAGRPAPLTDAAPKVPFTVTSSDWEGTLYDGTRRDKLPKNNRPIITRLEDGWLTGSFEQVAPKLEPHVGILKPDGSFRRIGPMRTDTAVKSPDGTQIALVTRVKDSPKDSKLAIIDVKTGAVVASVPVPHIMAGPVGWTSTGIWIHNGDIAPRARVWLWKPGEAALRTVPTPAGFEWLETSPQTDTVVLTIANRPPPGSSYRRGQAAEPREYCFQAGVFRDGRLDLPHKYCETTELGMSTVLSTDGQRVLTTGGTVVELATGKATKLELSSDDHISNISGSLFEDQTKVLVVTRDRKTLEGGRRLYRCEATTGECKLLRTEKPGIEITLGKP